MEEYNGVVIEKRGKDNQVKITWYTGYGEVNKCTKIFLSRDHAIKYIDTNNIQDIPKSFGEINKQINKGLYDR